MADPRVGPADMNIVPSEPNRFLTIQGRGLGRFGGRAFFTFRGESYVCIHARQGE